LSTVIYCLF